MHATFAPNQPLFVQAGVDLVRAARTCEGEKAVVIGAATERARLALPFRSPSGVTRFCRVIAP